MFRIHRGFSWLNEAANTRTLSQITGLLSISEVDGERSIR